mgnify:CR=1 FL=1
MIVKISHGYVLQKFENGKFIWQEFICGDDCVYEDENGNTLDADEAEKQCHYVPYEMIQPAMAWVIQLANYKSICREDTRPVIKHWDAKRSFLQDTINALLSNNQQGVERLVEILNELKTPEKVANEWNNYIGKLRNFLIVRHIDYPEV